jgi:cytochrome P450
MSLSFKTSRAPLPTLAAMNTRRTQAHLAHTPRARPPGPSTKWAGLPVLQHLAADFVGYLRQLHQAHGDLFHARVMWEEVYAVCSPALMREVLVDNAAHLIRQERPIEVFAEAQGPHSVIVTEGAQWERLHRILRPGFSPKRVSGYGALMAAAATRSLDSAVPAGIGASAVVQVDTWMDLLTMDVILRTLFSTQADGQTREVAHAIKALDAIAMKEFFWPMTLPDWWPLPGKATKRKALRLLNELVDGHLRARRKGQAQPAPGDDLLAMLLAARDNDAAPQRVQDLTLNDAEIRDQCKVMFLAGFETTSTALQWWTWLMARHPASARRAQQEIEQVLGTRTPTAEDLPQLPWLTATLKEAMRLYPPVPAMVTRRTTADVQVGGWSIPKGSLVMVLPCVAHHDTRYFPQPELFQPERFMPDAPALPRGAWMPFGAGPRVCIGQHFAMLEMVIIGAMLLQRYDLSEAPDQPPPEAEVQVTLRPRGGVKVRFERRASGLHPGLGSERPASATAHPL